jgi:ureidoglycolate lyase
MAIVRQLRVERLTPQAFAPFGSLIDAQDRPPDFGGLSGTQLWGLDFEVDGRLQLGFLRVPYQGLSCRVLEQHHGVTQAFIPVSGPPAVLAVAPPTEPDAVPDPAEVRAFLLEGRSGYIMKRNTWHSLDRYPLYPPHGDWIILTDWETTEDLLASPDRLGAKLTRAVDFEQRYGVTFQFDLQRIT